MILNFVFSNLYRLEMEGDDTNYGMLVEDLGLWALAVTGDIREKIRVSAKYRSIRNVFDLLPLGRG